MADMLKDFSPGPLDFYRKKASFDWKKLKVFFDTEDIVKFENELCQELENIPEYQRHPGQSFSFEEERLRAVKQSHIQNKMQLLTLDSLINDLKRPSAAGRIMTQFAPSSMIKLSVSTTMFESVLRSLGSERHFKFISDSQDGKLSGCFCLTEIAHGSNVKGMRTTAIYDKGTEQFIMHTPEFEGAKCWAGGLGQEATHALVYAQLIIDGVNYGLHTFVVPIRDPRTMLSYPGIIVGDMGEKIGLNGIDNGFLMFNQYRIPRINLLNKTGDVTKDGRYVTSYKDPSKKMGASLGALSAGRVAITNMCAAYGVKALTIAIRYSAVRKQFGPDDKEEVPILEYQTTQYRLLPYLSAMYVIRNFATFLFEEQYKFTVDQFVGNDPDNLPERGMELHAVSSASKPMAGWIMRDAIQQCREVCAGHGYLKAAGIGEIRNDADAGLTYEGENNVLIQQTSNWLLKFWPAVQKRVKIESPLGSVNFLSYGLDILDRCRFKATAVQHVCLPDRIMEMYQWLVCYLMKRTHEKYETMVANGMDPFWAKNESQVFFAKNLSVAFIEQFFLKMMLKKIDETTDPSISNTLMRLFSLFGLFSLEKHVPTLYEGGYAEGPNIVSLIHEAILKLCHDIKDDAVALVDAVAPPDFILNSVLGASDGRMYQRLQAAFFQKPGVMSRPDWWKEFVDDRLHAKSKL